MTGPALRQLSSHHAIHEAAHQEAEDITALLVRAVQMNEQAAALEAAYVLIEHWETRTLRHAAAEEEGLYMDAIRVRPELEPLVIALKRDHELLRLTVERAKELLQSEGPTSAVCTRFQLLLELEQMHSQEEEKRLLPALGRPASASETAS